jgi:DNA polymerase-3 subunit chi
MTRIDFYILPGQDPYTRRVTACKLIEKAYRQGHAIYLKTDSAEESRQFDDLLWTFRQGSFVPHELASATDGDVPVIIGHDAPPEGFSDVLVNMALAIPDGFDTFERVAEVVDQDETVRQAGRVRFKAYRDAGYPPETHRLDGA